MIDEAVFSSPALFCCLLLFVIKHVPLKVSSKIPAWEANEENVEVQVLLWFWLIFSAWVWMLLTSNWNFPTFPFIPWPCCSGKCVLHMYIEVEPGLIAVHTLPEDIERVAILSLKKEEEEKRLKSLWLWLCEDVIYLSTQVDWSISSIQTLIQK